MLSGWAPPKEDLPARLAERRQQVAQEETVQKQEGGSTSTASGGTGGTPFLVCHGDSDPVVLFECGEAVRDMLEAAAWGGAEFHT